jgi:lipid II:glycine glycyltransferase (peptidoglycan interpeptide bridge formation enzyme)
MGAVPLVSPSVLAIVDLQPDEDQLRARLHQKWRNRLRHAERQNLRVKRQNMPMDPTHWLLDADENQQRQRRYRGWPRALPLAFVRENPGAAKLFTAFWGREPVAAMLILRHGSTATYHIGHSRASGRIVSAHNVLMWSAMLWAKSKGLERFELGTLNTEDAPGLARFKLGTGAQPQTLGSTWLFWRPLRPFARPLFALDRRLMQE